MKTKLTLLVALLVAAWHTALAAPLNVVATLPDFAALAREVGGARVAVTAIARGTEDPHFVDARPSFIRLLNKADVLLEGGAQLEAGWLPPLVNNARNPRILAGGSGHVVMSEGIPLLDVPTGPIDRSMGDVHPAGNPHYWLDPTNGVTMAAHLAEVFSRLDPPHAADYRTNLAAFRQRLEARLQVWQRQMEPFRGVRVVTYHKSYDYLARRFGLEIVDQIEPKPGIEPSPHHIAELIPRLKERGVKLVLMEPNRSLKTGKYVADGCGAALVLLPGMVGGNEKVGDYLALFDYAVAQISAALKPSP